MLGREESFDVVKGKNADYVFSYQTGSCSICNREVMEEHEKEINKLEKEHNHASKNKEKSKT